MSDFNSIDIAMLELLTSDFDKEFNNFINNTYNGTFKTSYIYNCSNPYVAQMSSNLQYLYDDIDRGYTRINRWWIDYNKNARELEDTLEKANGSNSISESSISGIVGKMPELKAFKQKNAGQVVNAVAPTTSNSLFANNKVVSAFGTFSSIFSGYDVSATTVNSVVNNKKIANRVVNAASSAAGDISDGVKTMSKVAQDFNRTVENASSTAVGNISAGVKSMGATVSNFASQIGCEVSREATSAWSKLSSWQSDLASWWEDDALPWIKSAAAAVWDVVQSIGATIANFVTSLVEGICQFGEAIVDFAALVGTGAASIVTGLIDGGQAIYGAITGKEWSSVTKAMWEKTQGFVSKKHVSGWFDSMYENTAYGKWVKENSYGFDTVRSVGNGIGYISGVVVLSIATFGVGSVVTSGGTVTASTAAAATSSAQMAVVSTAAGVGKGTEKAWDDGAGLLQGLAAGTLSGLWEGLQFYVGGKINGVKIFGSDAIVKSVGSEVKVKLLNSLSHVILDGFDGAAEGFVQPFINSIYKTGYTDDAGNKVEYDSSDNLIDRYVEQFDDNGGWSSVLTNAVTSSTSSALGEGLDLRKYFKDGQEDIKVTNPKDVQLVINPAELNVKLNRYKELLDIASSDEYLKYIDNCKKGYAQVLHPEYDSVAKELASLGDELSSISKNSMSNVMDNAEIKQKQTKINNYVSDDQYIKNGSGSRRNYSNNSNYNPKTTPVPVDDNFIKYNTEKGRFVKVDGKNYGPSEIAVDVIDLDDDLMKRNMAKRAESNEKLFTPVEKKIDLDTSLTAEQKAMIDYETSRGHFVVVNGKEYPAKMQTDAIGKNISDLENGSEHLAVTKNVDLNSAELTAAQKAQIEYETSRGHFIVVNGKEYGPKPSGDINSLSSSQQEFVKYHNSKGHFVGIDGQMFYPDESVSKLANDEIAADVITLDDDIDIIDSDSKINNPFTNKIDSEKNLVSSLSDSQLKDISHSNDSNIKNILESFDSEKYNHLLSVVSDDEVALGNVLYATDNEILLENFDKIVEDKELTHKVFNNLGNAKKNYLIKNLDENNIKKCIDEFSAMQISNYLYSDASSERIVSYLSDKQIAELIKRDSGIAPKLFSRLSDDEIIDVVSNMNALTLFGNVSSFKNRD